MRKTNQRETRTVSVAKWGRGSRLLIVLAIAIALSLTGCVTTPKAVTPPGTAELLKGALPLGDTPPKVVKSDDSPTGYFVTFQYHAPDADRVRIAGEWYFSDIPHTTIAAGANIQPQDYQKGYIVFGPNGWDVQDMTLDPATGIWSITLPLPGGTWGYNFLVGGVGDDVLNKDNAQAAYDPSNPPLVYDYKNMSGLDFNCQVYVPYDSKYQIDVFDNPEQQPREGENGDFFYRDIAVDGRTYSFGIYLPYGFDADRAEAYPVLVLLEGNGNTWGNMGALRPIMDNMIADGRVEPTIVITPNGRVATDESGKRRFDMPRMMDAILNMLSYMADNYNASTDPDRRAIGGPSHGAAWSLFALFNNTTDFKYYLAMSPNMSETEPNYAKPDLMTRSIVVNMSAYDDPKSFNLYYAERDESGNPVPMPYGPDTGSGGNAYELIYELANAKIPFVMQGEGTILGHHWTFWRKALVYDLENILWK